MTKDERLARIEQLKAGGGVGRARIAESERQLEELAECDPIAFDDYLRAQRAAEAQASPPMSENPAPEVIYRDYNGDASRAAPAAEPAQVDWSAWEAWLAGHLAIERSEITKGIAEGMCMYVGEKLDKLRREFERELGVLRNENAELKGMLNTALQLITKSDVVPIRKCDDAT
jgi:hypothetical protein